MCNLTLVTGETVTLDVQQVESVMYHPSDKDCTVVTLENGTVYHFRGDFNTVHTALDRELGRVP